jgi:hypothetical protein
MKNQIKTFFSSTLLMVCLTDAHAQSSSYWHVIPRSVRYHPEGTYIVILNGERRFNRALYGGNTAFHNRYDNLRSPFHGALSPHFSFRFADYQFINSRITAETLGTMEFTARWNFVNTTIDVSQKKVEKKTTGGLADQERLHQ